MSCSLCHISSSLVFPICLLLHKGGLHFTLGTLFPKYCLLFASLSNNHIFENTASHAVPGEGPTMTWIINLVSSHNENENCWQCFQSFWILLQLNVKSLWKSYTFYKIRLITPPQKWWHFVLWCTFLLNKHTDLYRRQGIYIIETHDQCSVTSTWL